MRWRAKELMIVRLEQVVDRPAQTALPPSTILVVDDNTTNLQLMVHALERPGRRLLAARSGTAAIDIARQAQPDLVLLDVVMPGMDGFEVCERLKADPATRGALVIFLSALDEVADKVAALGLGAVDYVTKPIQAEEVQARVDTHLTRLHLERELRRSRDRLDRELAGAAEMQRLLLPRLLPDHPDLHFAAHYQTSRHAGGDYYDVVALDSARYGFIVADVSGHGAPAAIVMAMIRAVFHSAPSRRDDPATVLRHINDQFQFLRDTAVFATAVYGVVDRRDRTLRFACAGHPAPLRFRADAGVAALGCEAATPLLFADVGPLETAEHALAPGDRVLLYTDGITDREAPGGDMYDAERLRQAFRRAGPCDASGIVRHVVRDVEAFANGRESNDDQTLLLIAVD